MRKKEKKEKIKILVKNYITTISQDNDEWKIIVCNKQVSDYVINTKGVIKKRSSNTILKQTSSNGYKVVTLRINGKDFKLGVHRILACLFIPIPNHYIEMGHNQMTLYPNHKDGDKMNNDLSNIEWTTPRENTIHAFSNGLADISMRQNSHLATITDEDAIEICELLQRGYKPKFISEKLGIKEGIIRHIKNRECWTSISCNYTFHEPTNAPYKIPDEKIHLICRMLEEGKYSCKEIGMFTEVPPQTIRSIKRRNRRTDISYLYNF